MTTQVASSAPAAGFTPAQYFICLNGIVWREGLRFLHQRERFLAALVRPLVWLFIFAAGFRQVLGVSIIPPYDTYVLYEVYITPGLMVMIQLFNGMQSSLSMVYDREMGNMRTLLVSPLPRWYLLSSKLVAGTAVSLLQVYAFLAIAWFFEIEPPLIGYLTVLPALILSGGIDPATPPRHGAQVAATLPNARHFIAPQLGHGVSLHGCAPRLIETFVRKASAAELDGKCLERIPRPLFVLPLGTR